MHDMPLNTQEEISHQECADLLADAPFFENTDPSFLRQVSLASQTYCFAAGDIVLYAGDMGKEMYFVKKGYVEVSVYL